MLYLLMLRYRRPLAEIDVLLPAHREFIDRGYAEGRFLLSGPLSPREGGVILARFESPAAAADCVARDPFVQAGVVEVGIHAWAPNRQAGRLPGDWIAAGGEPVVSVQEDRRDES